MFKLLEDMLMSISIEAPRALFQEPAEIVWLNAVEALQVALGLVPEVLDPVDVVLVVCE